MLTRLRPDEERYARRMARIARWDRPIEGRGQRLRAWANMLLVDHGIFRLAYLNAHRVTPRLWRSALAMVAAACAGSVGMSVRAASSWTAMVVR